MDSSHDLANTMTTLKGTAAQWPSLLAQVSDILGLDSDESLFSLLNLIENELTLKPEPLRPEHRRSQPRRPEHRRPEYVKPEHFDPERLGPERLGPNIEDLRQILEAK